MKHAQEHATRRTRRVERDAPAAQQLRNVRLPGLCLFFVNCAVLTAAHTTPTAGANGEPPPRSAGVSFVALVSPLVGTVLRHSRSSLRLSAASGGHGPGEPSRRAGKQRVERHVERDANAKFRPLSLRLHLPTTWRTHRQVSE